MFNGDRPWDFWHFEISFHRRINAKSELADSLRTILQTFNNTASFCVSVWVCSQLDPRNVVDEHITYYNGL